MSAAITRVVDQLVGSGNDLDALQMGVRALVLFFITLVLIRVAGMRSFGRKSSFDTIMVIMLGAVLSRAVTGASPFWPTVVAATVLVVMHRIIAAVTTHWPRLERLIKGEARVLYHDGTIDWAAMHRAGISRADLDEATRRHAKRAHHSEVGAIVIESSGELSVLEAGHDQAARGDGTLRSG